MFEFDVTTSNPSYIEPLSNVVNARGMIGGYTFPNLERVKTRYKQSGLKDNNYIKTYKTEDKKFKQNNTNDFV